jgi:hypothetical protein
VMASVRLDVTSPILPEYEIAISVSCRPSSLRVGDAADLVTVG